MKISHICYFLFVLATTCVLFAGCTTIKVEIPVASADSKEQINIGSSSEIQGNYVLTNWQESVDESFAIGFESGCNAKILELVHDSLGINRYDIIAFIAGTHEIKAFIPAQGIFEHNKYQDDFDPLEMTGMLDKSWREVFKLKMPTEIRLMKILRIPSTKALILLIADEEGSLYKVVVSDATKFLDVDNYGVIELKTQNPVKLTKIADDRINAILPIFSKNAVFALLFSGDLLKIGLDTMKIEQTYADILWNGFDLAALTKNDELQLIVAGRHPINPIIIFGWDEVNEFKVMSKKKLNSSDTALNVFGSTYLFIKTNDKILLSDVEFSKVKAIENDFASKITSLDFTPDMERIFISAEEDAYIIGSKIENEELVLTSKKINLPGFAKDKSVTESENQKYIGKFLNNTFLMVIEGNKGRLIRSKFDKQIEGSIEIKTGRADRISKDAVPNYREIKKYKTLLDKIEEAGDWESMKSVYKSIHRDFSPTGTYFPGYAGTAMRGGWIEDTLADFMKDRELIAALIMLYWDEAQTAKLLGEKIRLLRKNTLPMPEYLKGKQPLIALHRAIIFQSKTPQSIVSKYIEYLEYWSESFKKGVTDFNNLGIDENNIIKMKKNMLNLGFEIFEYLPAPIRDYHVQLLYSLENSELLSDIPGLSTTLQNKREAYRTKWFSGR
ncbi:MAG: hypothetical protein K8S87_06165 [Planctomycetes bacterium]|nr:hypothetical protein [Planctomycetota bacterium]